MQNAYRCGIGGAWAPCWCFCVTVSFPRLLKWIVCKVGDPVAVLPIRLETLLVVSEGHFWEPAYLVGPRRGGSGGWRPWYREMMLLLLLVPDVEGRRKEMMAASCWRIAYMGVGTRSFLVYLA